MGAAEFELDQGRLVEWARPVYGMSMSRVGMTTIALTVVLLGSCAAGTNVRDSSHRPSVTIAPTAGQPKFSAARTTGPPSVEATITAARRCGKLSESAVPLRLVGNMAIQESSDTRPGCGHRLVWVGRDLQLSTEQEWDHLKRIGRVYERRLLEVPGVVGFGTGLCCPFESSGQLCLALSLDREIKHADVKQLANVLTRVFKGESSCFTISLISMPGGGQLALLGSVEAQN